MRTIQYGDADMIIAGGGEMATTPSGLGGFGQAKAFQPATNPPRRPAGHGTPTGTVSF